MFSEAGILSKDFTQGICDTQFIAARVDAENRGFKIINQNKLDCNRFEFMECVVRVAMNKYKVSGITTTIPEGIHTLVEAMKSSFKGHYSWEWR